MKSTRVKSRLQLIIFWVESHLGNIARIEKWDYIKLKTLLYQANGSIGKSVSCTRLTAQTHVKYLSAEPHICNPSIPTKQWAAGTELPKSPRASLKEVHRTIETRETPVSLSESQGLIPKCCLMTSTHQGIVSPSPPHIYNHTDCKLN